MENQGILIIGPGEMDQINQQNAKTTSQVIMGDGVEEVKRYAFSKWEHLVSVILPNTIRRVRQDAFSGCTNLQFNQYDNALYLGNESNPYAVLVKAVNGDITSCTLAEGTLVIADGAFRACKKLKDVTINHGLIVIGTMAFYQCTKLANIEIPRTVTTIGWMAFSLCSKLKTVFIPNSVVEMEASAFDAHNMRLNIYCEATQQPAGWEFGWAATLGEAEVYWNISETKYRELKK